MSSKSERIVGRIMQQIRLITNGHILNPVWKERTERRKQRYKATYEAAMHYLRRYIPSIRNFQPEDISIIPEPERAFSIWFQGEDEAPALVKSCFRSMRRHLDLELVVLTEKTIFDWISLPDYIIRKWKEGKISHAHFSDICRVELLYRHGGVWLDATDYVTAPIPKFIMDEEFFVFMSGERIRGCYSVIQNCFIRGKKGNDILAMWRHAMHSYWKEEDSKINYFVHHMLLQTSIQNNEHTATLFKKMPKVVQDPTHALWDEHCAEIYSKSLFESLTKDAFFQKTNFKDRRLKNMQSGTIAEYVINS